MKTALEFDCDCEATTTVEFEKPLLGAVKFKQFKCPGCRSTWELKVRGCTDGLRASHRLMPGMGTAKLGEALRKKEQHKLANAPVKKSPIFVVPSIPRKV